MVRYRLNAKLFIHDCIFNLLVYQYIFPSIQLATMNKWRYMHPSHACIYKYGLLDLINKNLASILNSISRDYVFLIFFITELLVLPKLLFPPLIICLHITICLVYVVIRLLVFCARMVIMLWWWIIFCFFAFMMGTSIKIWHAHFLADPFFLWACGFCALAVCYLAASSALSG